MYETSYERHPEYTVSVFDSNVLMDLEHMTIYDIEQLRHRMSNAIHKNEWIIDEIEKIDNDVIDLLCAVNSVYNDKLDHMEEGEA